MKFNYDLFGIGWALIHIEFENQSYFGTPSYISEPLIDLLESIISITPTCVPEDELLKEKSFRMYFEPAIEEWQLSLVDRDKVKLVIYSVCENTDSRTKVLFDMTCEYENFLAEIVSSISNLLSKYGLIGYKDNWYAKEFPLTSFLRIKYYLFNRSKYPVSSMRNEWSSDLVCSNFENELDFLTR